MVVHCPVATVYTDFKRIPRHATEYSINLWEADLAMFEVVTAEEEEAARRSKLETIPSTVPIPHLVMRWRGRRLRRHVAVHPNQLSLFLADEVH